jgi:primosomal protein N' (replication factor Y)
VTAPDSAVFVRVALEVPGADGFDYAADPGQAQRLQPGAWALVPWGRGRRVGIVVAQLQHTEVPPERLRSVLAPIDEAPRMPASWLALAAFAARYYHRGIGEVVVPAIPKLLRTPPGPKARGSVFARARARTGGAPTSPGDGGQSLPGDGGQTSPGAGARDVGGGPRATTPAARVEPTAAQVEALEALGAPGGFAVHLLHGVTGSGKTEVYLRWLERIVAQRPDAQVLLLVPEIALTPQLIAQIRARFPDEAVAMLHSDLPDGERASHWMAAADGRVRMVVGTRLAVFAPLPRLAAIVVDEEHDASYKQQEGVRYSARDLAIALAQLCDVPVVLGSATPSLESWYAAQRGRYALLPLPERASGGALPRLRVVDPRGRALRHGLAPETVQAIEATLARREQALVFMNRRGYAPVLACEACGWLSRCELCSAYRVLHRAERGAPGQATRYRMVCHHCSAEAAVPRACPDCGNVDLSPVGRGTQRLEDGLHELFPGARVGRVDRDVARRRGAAREVIDAAHAGEVDLLVGTQMLAKGHDFRRLTLVVVVDADGALYSSDFRAPERLFAVLMQVAGRAGRSGAASEVIVQTRFPSHPLFGALARHDYAGFADAQLAERRASALPPFQFQALMRAEARTLDAALELLAGAKRLGDALLDAPDGNAGDGAPPDDPLRVRLYDPVPMPLMRLAGHERAQLLLECASRKALHAFLDAWIPRLATLRGGARWQLDVDPVEI